MRAVEYGEMVQRNGEWVFQSTEDPVLKLMLTKGLITNQEILQSFSTNRKKLDRTGRCGPQSTEGT